MDTRCISRRRKPRHKEFSIQVEDEFSIETVLCGELLEAILAQLPCRHMLFFARFVCRRWRDIAERVQKNMQKCDHKAQLVTDCVAARGYVPLLETLDPCLYRRNYLRLKCLAARYGQRVCFQYLYDGSYEDTLAKEKILKKAARGGDVIIFEPLYTAVLGRRKRWFDNGEITVNAARGGHLHILKRTLNNDVNWISVRVAQRAAQHGHRHVLEWLCARGITMGDDVMESAESYGCLDTMKWLRNNHNVGFNELSGGASANAGRMDILEWLASQGETALGPWCAHAAAAGGQIGVLEWLEERQHFKAGWKGVLSGAVNGGRIEPLEWLDSRGREIPLDDFDMCDFHATVEHGALDVLQWVYVRYEEIVWRRIAATDECAAQYGHVHILRFMEENGLLNDNRMRDAACRHGRLAVLHWIDKELIQRGDFPPGWTTAHMITAVRYDRLDVIKFLRSRGCAWSIAISTEAMKYCRIETQEWMRDAEYPWDRNECPWNRNEGIFAYRLSAGNHGSVTGYVTEYQKRQKHQPKRKKYMY